MRSVGADGKGAFSSSEPPGLLSRRRLGTSLSRSSRRPHSRPQSLLCLLVRRLRGPGGSGNENGRPRATLSLHFRLSLLFYEGVCEEKRGVLQSRQYSMSVVVGLSIQRDALQSINQSINLVKQVTLRTAAMYHFN